MWRRDENDARDVGPGIKDQCLPEQRPTFRRKAGLCGRFTEKDRQTLSPLVSVIMNQEIMPPMLWPTRIIGR